MSILSYERHGKQSSESKSESLIRRQLELARAVLPITENEAADATFIEAEGALSHLNAEAEEMMQERGKPTRKLRRSLSHYAHRLLELAEQEPDLLNPRSISLVAHASDATGERKLLQTTLEHAQRAAMTSDTDVNLQAIQAALELDMPFSEVMRTLNLGIVPFSEEPPLDHIPLEKDYDYLFDASATGKINRSRFYYDNDHQLSAGNRPLYKDEK